MGFGALIVVLLVGVAGAAAAQAGFITTVAGTGTAGFNGDNILATSAHLRNPVGVALDTAGNLFIADSFNHRIRRLDAGTGLITTVAGTGASGFNGDNILATNASLFFPFGVALDTAGNLFIADVNNHRIRRVDAGTGLITTVAGTGAFGFNGDNILATNASLFFPFRVALDTAGNLFIGDTVNHRIRRVDAGTGLITTVAGTGTAGFNGDNILATNASLSFPVGVALDTAGNPFFADSGNNRIRRVESNAAVFIEVRIDIKPGSDPNSINAKSRGDIPVAILATADYDPLDVVHGVDPATVLFAGASKAHPNRPLGHWEDVDGDGDTDLLLHFDAQDVFNNPDGLSCGDTGAVLTGFTYDGVAIEGMDFVVTVACK